jgi:hypothetical protein
MREAKSPARKQAVFRQIEAGAGRESIAGLLVASRNSRVSRPLDVVRTAYQRLSFGQLCSRLLGGWRSRERLANQRFCLFTD